MNINHKLLKKNSSRAAALLKTLANPARLLILCQLIGGEKNVGDLAATSRLSQSAFSQHLAVLRRAKIVTTRKESQVVYYSLSGDHAVRVIELMYEIYCT